MSLTRARTMIRFAALLAAVLFRDADGVCAQATTAPSSEPANTREVTDEVGRTVRVPLAPSRIVSLAPNLTETVYALGLQDRLVGDTNYCDYPPEAQKKTKVGGAINPNLEEIAALHPDLVLVTKSLNRLETVRALDTLGIPSYATDEPHTVEEIISSTRKLAGVLGAPGAGESIGEDLQHRLGALREKLNGIPPKRVLFIVWTEPLISVGKDTFIADALRKAGAQSIVESAQPWPKINLEEVASLQPEYLVFADSHAESASISFDSLSTLPGWRLLDAVHNRRYVALSDAVNRPAPRLVAVIEGLARQLHPEAFSAPASTGKDSQPGQSVFTSAPRTVNQAPRVAPCVGARQQEPSCIL